MGRYLIYIKGEQETHVAVGDNPVQAIKNFMALNNYVFIGLSELGVGDDRFNVKVSPEQGSSDNYYLVRYKPNYVIWNGNKYMCKRYNWEELVGLFPDVVIALDDVVREQGQLISGILRGLCTSQDYCNVVDQDLADGLYYEYRYTTPHQYLRI